MPFPDRTAALQSLLLTAGIHRGLVVRPSRRLASGIPPLDALLSGGLPVGAITELVGPRSSGKTALSCALTAGVTGSGAFTAYIDFPDAFDPEQAAAAGIRLPRVLWIRPPSVRAALRGAEYVLEAGGFALVVIDVDHPLATPRATPTAAWLRLARTVAASAAAVVTIAPQPIAGSSASVCLETTAGAVSFSGGDGRGVLFDGITTALLCRKNKLGPPSPSTTPFRAATA